MSYSIPKGDSMKNKILKSMKKLYIMLSISMTLFSGPIASNEISKMLKSIDEGNAVIKEMNEANCSENDFDKLKK
jgi:hypothetical protein